MENDGTLNLLLVHDNIDDANRLVSLLRNASYKVNQQHCDSKEVLTKLLQEQKWDIALVQFDNRNPPTKTIFSEIRKLNRDIPVILIPAEHDANYTVDGLRMGATDVVPMDEDQHLLQVVSRTLYNLDQRRKQRYWKQRYTATEERCDGLMASSRDAIAIVQEGTYVFVNDTYANLFGYLEADGMVLLPVVDSAEESFQGELKPYLKPVTTDDSVESTTLTFVGVKPDNGTFNIPMNITQVEYQGDPALQFLVRKELLSPFQSTPEHTAETHHAVAAVGAIALRNMLEHISAAIRKTSRSEASTVLHYLRIDRFAALQESAGIKIAEDVATNVAQFVSEQLSGASVFGRIREDAFVLLVNKISPDDALVQTTGLLKAVAEKVFEIGEQTYSVTLSAGLYTISDSSSTAEGCISFCQKAIAKIDDDNPDAAGNAAHLFEEVFEPTATDLAEADIVRFGKQLLEKRLLDITFQPIASIHGEKSEFYEVLMRSKVDAYPKEIPQDFIDRVFKTDVASDIDRWVIMESMKKLVEKHKTRPNTKLFIHISAATMRDAQFMPWLKVALKAANMAAESLIFQLREIDVSRQLNHAVKLLDELKKINGKTALTHFGVAINPLNILKKLSVDYVKLDLPIVERARSDESAVDTMHDLINRLRGEDQCVIVPFIENPGMIPALWQYGVQYIQGHYIQSPQSTMNYDFSEEG